MAWIQPKPIVFWPHVFSRAWRRLHVIASNSDWFIVLFTSVTIGQSNYFELNWKPLYYAIRWNLFLFLPPQAPLCFHLWCRPSAASHCLPVPEQLLREFPDPNEKCPLRNPMDLWWLPLWRKMHVYCNRIYCWFQQIFIFWSTFKAVLFPSEGEAN